MYWMDAGNSLCSFSKPARFASPLGPLWPLNAGAWSISFAVARLRKTALQWIIIERVRTELMRRVHASPQLLTQCPQIAPALKQPGTQLCRDIRKTHWPRARQG